MTDSELEKFKKVLKDENLKLTPQRVEVFREVCNTEEHREAEEIYLALRKRDINVSRSTVYRTMDILYNMIWCSGWILEMGNGVTNTGLIVTNMIILFVFGVAPLLNL